MLFFYTGASRILLIVSGLNLAYLRLPEALKTCMGIYKATGKSPKDGAFDEHAFLSAAFEKQAEVASA